MKDVGRENECSESWVMTWVGDTGLGKPGVCGGREMVHLYSMRGKG